MGIGGAWANCGVAGRPSPDAGDWMGTNTGAGGVASMTGGSNAAA